MIHFELKVEWRTAKSPAPPTDWRIVVARDPELPALHLDWEAFTPGELSTEKLQASTRIPVDDRSADPGYSTHWEDLYLTHGQAAPLKPEATYTLFRGLSKAVRYEADPRANPEYPYAFALLSKEPLSNGRHWVLFYLRKGRSD